MLIDTIQMMAGTKIENATIDSGATLPASNYQGGMFYKTGSNAGLYYNDGSAWTLIISANISESAYVNATGDSMTGPLSLAGSPTLDSHAATKAYVDQAVTGVATGLDFKPSVLAATTANITLSGLQTVDGIALSNGDRVLVKDQTTASQNGIYVANSSSWARATDFDSGVAGEVSAGAYTYVEAGTANAGTGWVVTTTGSITVGTTGITFTKISSTVVPTHPYDVATYCSGKPAASEKVLALKVVTAFTTPTNLAGSVATAATAATASTVFTINKNGTQFSSFTFAAAGTTASIGTCSSQTFNVGDVLTIVAPASADATLADIMFTIKGTA